MIRLLTGWKTPDGVSHSSGLVNDPKVEMDIRKSAPYGRDGCGGEVWEYADLTLPCRRCGLDLSRRTPEDCIGHEAVCCTPITLAEFDHSALSLDDKGDRARFRATVAQLITTRQGLMEADADRSKLRQDRDAWKTRADDAESKLRPNYTVLAALADEAAAKMEADRLRREMATEGDAYRALITEHAALQAKYESAQKEIDRVLALTKGSEEELDEALEALARLEYYSRTWVAKSPELDHAAAVLKRLGVGKTYQRVVGLLAQPAGPKDGSQAARESEERLNARIRALKAVAKAAAADAEAI